MNKIKKFVKENKTLVIATTSIIVVGTAALTLLNVAVAQGFMEDDSVEITTHPDGSFTVSAVTP